MKIKNSSESEFFISYANFNYPIKHLAIKANILEDEIKIENCVISNSASDISVKGKIENLKKSLDAELEISTKKVEVAKYNYLFKTITGNKLFDQYLGNNFGILLFQNDTNVFNEIKNLESAKIFDNNIHLMTEDNKFNQDKKISNWAKENNISAAIIRPDQHIYGCVDDEDIVNNIDKLTTKLKGELFKH